MAELQLPVLRHKPEFGKKTDFGIGIVGAGGIVDAAHLPAYKKAGFHVVGIYDPDMDRAEKLASKFSIRKVYSDSKELLDDRSIEIVDIAVPPVFQEEIALQALQAGKDLLCQKPLHHTFSTAARIVQAAERAGRKLAVNENMRWDPAMRASRQLIEEGWIGQPTLATFDINYREDWTVWPWLGSSERLAIMFDAIHPLYALRMLFGEPTGIFSTIARAPGQKERGETRALITLEFAKQMSGMLLDSSTNPTQDFVATFRFDGTEGSIKGSLGIYYDYPLGRADELSICTKRLASDEWHPVSLEGRWIPNAFAGPMAALMKSIESGTEAENSGKEHLKTLQMVEAAYRSAKERRMISPLEIKAE
jgi:predicted dehydrogenase